jgi:hypothetical protein
MSLIELSKAQKAAGEVQIEGKAGDVSAEFQTKVRLLNRINSVRSVVKQ